MKILMVSEDLPGVQIGGLGKHVVTVANALLARGHTVDILGRNDCGAPDIGFHGKFIAGFDYRHPGWKEAQLGFFNPLKRPWFAAKIGRAIMAHGARYDVVHYHGHLPMVGLHLAEALNFVQTRHDQGSECLTHLRFLDNQVCRSTAPQDCAACISGGGAAAAATATATVTSFLPRALTAAAVRRYRSETAATFGSRKTVFVSDFLRRQFLRAVPDADLSRCRVMHNVVDYAGLLAHARGACVVPGRLLLAGRLDVGKGFGEFLGAAAARLAPELSLLVLGDGPLRARLAAAHGGARIVFAGWRAYPEVIGAQACSQLCVVPSLCEEACSTTVLEALALGRPCIALARGGTPELAAYQRYPGQLQLGADIDELVALAWRQMARAPTPLVLAPDFGADVARSLPGLLDFYAA